MSKRVLVDNLDGLFLVKQLEPPVWLAGERVEIPDGFVAGRVVAAGDPHTGKLGLIAIFPRAASQLVEHRWVGFCWKFSGSRNVSFFAEALRA